MPKAIREAGPLAVAAATSGDAVPIVLISPGWGSSGYYSSQVLENAANAKIFSKGLQLYLDHPGEAESYDRPERSVRDLAATLSGDAVWDGKQLVGEAVPFGAAAEMLANREFASAIGLSIRAYADSTIGEAEGRKGQIITELVEAISVDFVTKAGRGGRVLVELMESTRPEQVVQRAVRSGVQEATANDTRAALGQALKDSYGGDKSWVWVRDFDETTVWFEYETPDGMGTYAETYELDEQGVVTLSGSPTEVRARTEYVPVKPAAESSGSEATGSTDQTTNVPAPAGQSTATESEETHMATTQIEESRLAQLEKDSERVQSLESERNADRTALAEAHRLIDNAEAHTIVRTAAREADIRLNDFEVAGIAADYPKGEDGRIDKDKLTESAKAAVATLAESRGAGSITGFGSTAATDTSDVVAEAEQASAAAFGRTITKEA